MRYCSYSLGKRCAMWMQDFVLDFEEMDRLIETLPMRGVKGTTGTQASFLGYKCFVLQVLCFYFLCLTWGFILFSLSVKYRKQVTQCRKSHRVETCYTPPRI